MEPIRHFLFCPRCGQQRRDKADEHAFRCESCHFLYYFNPAIAAAVFVTDPDAKTLFIRRAKEPAKGKLALPGGFVDLGETAENAVRREAREEVNLELDALEFLCSQPNHYQYRDVTYPVLDLFFVARAKPGSAAAALDGVESCDWFEPSQVNPVEIAFPSIREAWAVFLKTAWPAHQQASQPGEREVAR